MLTRSLVALLLWVAGLLAPVAAHGPVPTLSENRVWAPAVENQTFTGADRLLSLELHRSNAPPTVRFASGDSVGPARVRQVNNLRTIDAADVNAGFVARGQNPPFAAGTRVREFEAASDLSFVRVHNASNPRGGWFVRADEIAGMSPQQIQRHLALPAAPTHIQNITVPRGTTLQMGRVGPQPDWGVTTVGGVQYRSTGFLPESAFGASRNLP